MGTHGGPVPHVQNQVIVFDSRGSMHEHYFIQYSLLMGLAIILHKKGGVDFRDNGKTRCQPPDSQVVLGIEGA